MWSTVVHPLTGNTVHLHPGGVLGVHELERSRGEHGYQVVRLRTGTKPPVAGPVFSSLEAAKAHTLAMERDTS